MMQEQQANSHWGAEQTMDLVRRLGGDAETIELCGRVVSSSAEGNVCLTVRPEVAERLQASPAVSTGLFVLEGNRLYTRRNWNYEQRIREYLKRAAESSSAVEPSVAVPRDGMFANLNDAQREGVAMMCREKFSLLTGGPGTGKTYTIARAVKLMREREPSLRLGLAAPTGKAAARVKEAMMSEAKALGLAGGELEATTIHSLLKANYDLVSFQHNHANPLPLDWLIVDEASMIDLPLMAKLLDALPEHCRLTLVGDAHQLASVEPGRVFGDLCQRPELPKCTLVESRRFPADGDIHRFAAAVNGGQAQDALALLDNSADLQFVPLEAATPKASQWPGFEERIKELFGDFQRQTSAAAIFANGCQILNSCRVLCAFREGPYGVRQLNSLVKKLLGDKCPQPIMVTKNDRSLGVNNGDVGVILPTEPEKAYFPGHEKPTPVALLPEWELAFATTVHKAQGSEFSQVVVVLPGDAAAGETATANPLLTREILYTAITRTKKKVFLFSGKEAIRQCCRKRIERNTGLGNS